MAIEIVAVEGTDPDDQAIEFFKKKLDQNDICNYDNIRIALRTVKITSFEPWTRSKLVDFEKTNRETLDLDPDDKHLKLFISYIPGPYVEPGYENLAGLHYAATSFSIIRSGCNVNLEDSTLLHEFGHTLNFDFESREEPPVNKDRPSHCNNPRCVMYWKITNSHKDFDMACRIDLCRLIRDN